MVHQPTDADTGTGLPAGPRMDRKAQQIAYVEHILRGGKGSHEFRLNCPGWQRSYKGPLELVDGLQRLTALRLFLAGGIPAFGHYCYQYEDNIPLRITVSLSINDLPTRADVLRWYIELNSGGVVHSQADIDRVQALLDQEPASQS